MQCVLVVNMVGLLSGKQARVKPVTFQFTEKIFVFLWLWFVFLATISTINIRQALVSKSSNGWIRF